MVTKINSKNEDPFETLISEVEELYRKIIFELAAEINVLKKKSVLMEEEARKQRLYGFQWRE